MSLACKNCEKHKYVDNKFNVPIQWKHILETVDFKLLFFTKHVSYSNAKLLSHFVSTDMPDAYRKSNISFFMMRTSNNRLYSLAKKPNQSYDFRS